MDHHCQPSPEPEAAAPAAAAHSPSSPCIPSSLSYTFPCLLTPASDKPTQKSRRFQLKSTYFIIGLLMMNDDDISKRVKGSGAQYFLLLQTQLAPTLSDHLCELPLFFWILRLE